MNLDYILVEIQVYILIFIVLNQYLMEIILIGHK